MHTTDPYQATLTSNRTHAAGGLRMMARHLFTSYDAVNTTKVHPTRLVETADQMAALLHDATGIVGSDQHDRLLHRGIEFLRDTADAGRPMFREGDAVTMGVLGTRYTVASVTERGILRLTDQSGSSYTVSSRQNVRLDLATR